MHDDAGLFDVDSVRRFEAAARRRVAEGVLMERAGQAAWRMLLELWPAAHRIVVICGSGGNGGDGYVLARHALEAGRDVRVVTADDRDPTHAEAHAARRRFTDAGGRNEVFAGELPAADLIVDALLGIGAAGPPSPLLATLIHALNAHRAPVLSLDVPSGLVECGGIGGVVQADATVEFLLPKLLLRTGPAQDVAGRVQVDRLGIDACDVSPAAMCLGVDALARRLLPRRRDSHKGTHGRVLCIGGDVGSGGAVLMCAEAALRSGAGLVRVHTHVEHVSPLLARLPEAMVSTNDADLAWPDVVAIGPGLGRQPWGEALWTRALAAAVPLVLDADALNLLATTPRPLPPDSVLTPHPAEAARLLGSTVDAVQRDRIGALHALVARFGSSVVLKGAGTLVGAPGKCPMLIAAGGPALATGGTGDVLTGVIAALRGQGLDAFDAACTGALLHGAAGDLAARDGERGMRATDLTPHLRRLANP